MATVKAGTLNDCVDIASEVKAANRPCKQPHIGAQVTQRRIHQSRMQNRELPHCGSRLLQDVKADVQSRGLVVTQSQAIFGKRSNSQCVPRSTEELMEDHKRKPAFRLGFGAQIPRTQKASTIALSLI